MFLLLASLTCLVCADSTYTYGLVATVKGETTNFSLVSLSDGRMSPVYTFPSFAVDAHMSVVGGAASLWVVRSAPSIPPSFSSLEVDANGTWTERPGFAFPSSYTGIQPVVIYNPEGRMYGVVIPTNSEKPFTLCNATSAATFSLDRDVCGTVFGDGPVANFQPSSGAYGRGHWWLSGQGDVLALTFYGHLTVASGVMYYDQRVAGKGDQVFLIASDGLGNWALSMMGDLFMFKPVGDLWQEPGTVIDFSISPPSSDGAGNVLFRQSDGTVQLWSVSLASGTFGFPIKIQTKPNQSFLQTVFLYLTR